MLSIPVSGFTRKLCVAVRVPPEAITKAGVHPVGELSSLQPVWRTIAHCYLGRVAVKDSSPQACHVVTPISVQGPGASVWTRLYWGALGKVFLDASAKMSLLRERESHLSPRWLSAFPPPAFSLPSFLRSQVYESAGSPSLGMPWQRDQRPGPQVNAEPPDLPLQPCHRPKWNGAVSLSPSLASCTVAARDQSSMTNLCFLLLISYSDAWQPSAWHSLIFPIADSSTPEFQWDRCLETQEVWVRQPC